MQNSKFYEFSSCQAESYRLNDCMLIIQRQDDFEKQVCGRLIIHFVKKIIPR
jgi:hypothetical protein